MATITFPATPSPVATVGQTVSTKTTWAGSWTNQPLLHCSRLTFAASPGVSSAEFHWRFGQRIAPTSQSVPVSAATPRTYVRVQVTGTAGRSGYEWFGLWKTVTLEPPLQRYQADGFESLLTYETITSCPFRARTGTIDWSFEGLAFNSGGRPNRSAGQHTVNGFPVYVWDGTENAKYWTTREAVRTLLAIGTPKDAAGNPVINWNLDATAQAALSDKDRPVLETHGRDALSLVNSLITRYRLTGWTVKVNDTNNVFLRPFTFAEADVQIKDGAGAVIDTITANTSTHKIVLKDDPSGRSSLSTEASHVADRVRVIGDRRKIVFSVSKTDNSLDRAWTAAEQTKYLAAAKNHVNYPPAAELKARDEMNRAVRTSDELRHVFARFKLPDHWNQKVGDGVGFNDLAKQEGDFPGQRRIYEGALALLPELPFVSGYDYAGSTIGDNAGQAGHRGDKTGDPPHQALPLLVVFKRTPITGQTWVLADRLGNSADQEAEADSLDTRWSVETRVVSGQPAFEVRVSGQQQHVLAFSDFAGVQNEVGGFLEMMQAGGVDWRELIATVAIEDTKRLVVSHPDPVNPIGEFVNELVREVSGFGQIDVRPGTVVGLDAESKLVRSDGGLLEDDTDELLAIAERLYEWHKTPRYALALSTAWIDGTINLGDLITHRTDIDGQTPVGSVVTEITLEMPVAESGEPPASRFSLSTQYGELQ